MVLGSKNKSQRLRVMNVEAISCYDTLSDGKTYNYYLVLFIWVGVFMSCTNL